jgi:hypothetical protein
MEDDEKCAMDDDLDLRLSSLNFLSDFRSFENEETLHIYTHSWTCTGNDLIR